MVCKLVGTGIAPVVTAVLSCLLAFGQPATPPAFEAASIRPVDLKPDDPRFVTSVKGGPGTSDPGMVTYANVNLINMVRYAYDLQSFSQIDWPDLPGKDYYDITARIPPGTTKEQFHLMLQGLLADRFHMVVHHDTKLFDAYELAVGKGGPKMKLASAEDSAMAEQPGSGPLLPPGRLPGSAYPQLLRPGIIAVPKRNSEIPFNLHLMARAQTMGELAKSLASYLGRSVADKTGLSGRYDFELDFTLEQAATDQRYKDAQDDFGPYIPVAVEVLGLKTVPVKVSRDIVVVDRAERVPTPN